MKPRISLTTLPNELLDPSISDFLDNESFAMFERANKTFYGLFKPKLDQIDKRLEKTPGIPEELFFRNFKNKNVLKIKKLIETWCQMNKLKFDSLEFKGQVKSKFLGIDKNAPQRLNVSNKSHKVIQFSREEKGILHIAFHHSFLPSAIREVLPDMDMEQAIKKFSTFSTKKHLPLSQGGQQELTYQTKPNGDIPNEDKLTPEEMERYSFHESKKGSLLHYNLLLKGSIGNGNKFIPLIDLFPESAKEGFVIFNLVAPVSYQTYYYCEMTPEELRNLREPDDYLIRGP